MSSGFVSGGTADKPIERDDAWLAAQKEVEDSRRRQQEEAQQAGGKSLYEVLQANKAAKQTAFEESIQLKNQFRSLDEDEVEFLDSVLESTRTKEQALKKETLEQLELFRRQQEEADKKQLQHAEDEPESQAPNAPVSGELVWTFSGRKRKRTKEKEGSKGIKMQRSSSADGKHAPGHETEAAPDQLSKPALSEPTRSAGEGEIASAAAGKLQAGAARSPTTRESVTGGGAPSEGKPNVVTPTVPTIASGLGLTGYSSSEED